MNSASTESDHDFFPLIVSTLSRANGVAKLFRK